MGRAFFTVSILSALAISTAAQVPLAAQEYTDDPAVAQAERLSPRELDSLLAPIALYPDQLLAPILMAATYPNDVEEAADWTSIAVNASMRGDSLAFALETREWDPSVKTLAQFPDVLRMLDDEWDWMVRVGNAFLLQESEVMDSVQRLRHQAYAMGTLRSTDLQRVRFENGAVIIDMIDPATVYIPTYDPVRAYGFWSYPDYPPYYFHSPIRVTRYAVIPTLWGWSSWEWNRHRIRVDMPRYRYFNRHHPWRYNDDTWRHDRNRRGRDVNFRQGNRRGEWRGNDRRDNTWNGGANDRRDGGWDGRRDWNRDANRDGRDGRGDRDGRRDRRNDQRANVAPNVATPTPPAGGFRGDSENRRRFGENRQFEGGFRGRPPQNTAPSQPQAGEDQERQRRRFRGEGNDGPRRDFDGGRQSRGRQDRQAYAGPQLTPPAPVAPLVQEAPRVNREERRREFQERREARGAFRAQGGGNPEQNRRQFGGNGGGENRFRGRPDGNGGGGNRELRRGGGGGNSDGDGERRGNGRGRGNGNGRD